MAFSKFLDPKNDVAFKHIFGTEKNKDILIHFINDMIEFRDKQKIVSVQFLKTNQDPDIASKKQSILDVLCTDEKGRQYIVEMQVARTAGFEQRAQYYAAKAYSSQLNHSEQYTQLKEIIFVAITDFVMFPKKKDYKSDHVILDKVTYSRDLKDFSFTFLELPKFKKNIDELSNIVEKWAYFFKHATETSADDLVKIIGDDDIIERAYDALDRFLWTDIEMNTYEAELKRARDEQAALDYKLETAEAKGVEKGLVQGLEKGLVQGLVQGEKLAIYRVAKQMLQEGLPLETVAKITQLSLSELKGME